MRLSAATAALVVVLTACGDHGEAGVPPSGTPTPSPGTDIGALHLPIEAYLLPPRLSVVHDRLRNVLIHACMRGFGLSYPAPPAATRATDRAATDAYTVMYRRYGVTDARTVHTWGYHVPLVPATRAAAPVRLSDLPAAARRVLLGTEPATGVSIAGRTAQNGRPIPPGGCVGASDRRLAPSGSDPATRGIQGPQGPQSGPGGLVATIKSDSFASSAADPRVTAVFSNWSSCMRAAGYRVSDPMHATSALSSVTAAKPDAGEIAQAEADVACKTRTNVVGIWFAVESDYQKAAIRKNAKALAVVKAELAHQVGTISSLAERYGA
ncbi:hypothetical protein RKE30_26440 [Streptomyces sp. Li-HN-5-11]|uniref:hypothetical protein n=1 Tax=Streptomyces sp. Li-HN-5-11 TaxID=3075432 RepID=UPI0028A8B1AE|nr:hypothetical protein [Streptomyces sp. Li-HN-5-11]WNM33674.1 hypothetical protein RKE30_26440 [Streptomyces sp. Li-HN-5-11]